MTQWVQPSHSRKAKIVFHLDDIRITEVVIDEGPGCRYHYLAIEHETGAPDELGVVRWETIGELELDGITEVARVADPDLTTLTVKDPSYAGDPCENQMHTLHRFAVQAIMTALFSATGAIAGAVEPEWWTKDEEEPNA